MSDDAESAEDEQDEFTATLTPELRAQEEYLRAQVAWRPIEHQKGGQCGS